jgi:hypothetical protein
MGGPMGARGPGGQSVLPPSRFLQPVSYAVMYVLVILVQQILTDYSA